MGRTWTLQAGKAAFSPETTHFEITDVILCVKGLRDVKILKCCCEQSSAEFMTQHVPGLYWKGKGKHFKRVFRMHMKPKLHKHVHSCLQPISKSLRFLVCCSHTWENPQCRVFPNTPLNHRGWHKIKAFRLEFLGYASYHLLSLLYSVRTWNGCYSLVTINTVCLAMPERHLGLCPLFHLLWCAPPMARHFAQNNTTAETSHILSFLFQRNYRNWNCCSFLIWSRLTSKLDFSFISFLKINVYLLHWMGTKVPVECRGFCPRQVTSGIREEAIKIFILWRRFLFFSCRLPSVETLDFYCVIPGSYPKAWWNSFEDVFKKKKVCLHLTTIRCWNAEVIKLCCPIAGPVSRKGNQTHGTEITFLPFPTLTDSGVYPSEFDVITNRCTLAVESSIFPEVQIFNSCCLTLYIAKLFLARIT